VSEHQAKELEVIPRKIMCGNDKTTPIERDEEIEVLVIEEDEKKITSSSMLASSCTMSCFNSPA
jgi:hypothetical protein